MQKDAYPQKYSEESPSKSVTDYLLPKAQEIRAARRAKVLEEQRRAEEKTAKEAFHIRIQSQYQASVEQTKKRLAKENDYCNQIINLQIYPLLEEIKFFAKKNSMYPLPQDAKVRRSIEEVLDIPIYLFNEVREPSLHSKLDISDRWENDAIEEYLERQIADLSSKHAYRVCGITWEYSYSEEKYSGEDGWGNSHYRTETYILTYGIDITVKHTGEIILEDLCFESNQLSGNEFKKVLASAFYSPIHTNKYRATTKGSNKEREKSSLGKILAGMVSWHFILNSWKKLWNDPEEDITHEASFLKKMWYGFPLKEKEEKDTKKTLRNNRRRGR